jgi:hypothetical protein
LTLFSWLGGGAVFKPAEFFVMRLQYKALRKYGEAVYSKDILQEYNGKVGGCMETKLKVKTESLLERCEICHQTDLFDPHTNFCERCNQTTSIEQSIKGKQITAARSKSVKTVSDYSDAFMRSIFILLSTILLVRISDVIISRLLNTGYTDPSEIISTRWLISLLIGASSGLAGGIYIRKIFQSKKCLFCAEKIRKEAIKCRYCGSSVEQ